MTTLAHLATNQFIITRKSTVSGYRKTYATTTGVRANLQPITTQKAQIFDGVPGKTFVIYADGVYDIQEGDRFRDINTNEIYQVMTGGVSTRAHGAIDFHEIVVQLIN